MLLAKHQTIRLIGFDQSTLTQEARFFFQQEHRGLIEVVQPEWFLQSPEAELSDHSYCIAFSLDRVSRSAVIDRILGMDLDCVIYIHPSSVCYFDLRDPHTIQNHIGIGSFVGPMNTVLYGSRIGNHCIIESQCLIAHHVVLGDNIHIHPGVIVAGSTTIDNNCVLSLKSAVLPKINICADVEIGATSTVTKNIDRPGRYVGSPARRIGDISSWDPNT